MPALGIQGRQRIAIRRLRRQGFAAIGSNECARDWLQIRQPWLHKGGAVHINGGADGQNERQYFITLRFSVTQRKLTG